MTGNLLIIMSDEHQARAMGCAGHPFVQTPNFDRLATDSLRFTNAYTPSPICVPARAAFAAGRYVHQIRLWDNAMPYIGDPPGWGHALQAKDIPVESIGKLHYRKADDPAGFDVEHIPMNVVGGVGMVWASIRKEDERITPDTRMLGDYIGPGDSKYTDYDAAVVKRTKQWFADRAASGDGRPWCLFIGLVAPHFPLVVPQRFFDLYPLDALPPVKLHPRDGHPRHPWVEKQNAFMDSESKFRDELERLTAIAAYYGLCSWLDSNLGEILSALEASGMSGDTTVVYTSDHGDNAGARGLWGKSNMYEEAAAVPLMIRGPRAEPGTCDTAVSLVDLSETVTDHFGADLPGRRPGWSLYDIGAEPVDPDRVVFSEYHAAGAVSAAYMIRKGRHKYVHYVGFEPELFDLAADPEETVNLAGDPAYAPVRTELEGALEAICDPDAMNDLAMRDQAAMIEGYGGRDAALKLGARGATPPPELKR